MPESNHDPKQPKTDPKLKHREVVALIAGAILTVLMVIGYYNNNQPLYWYALAANAVILYLVNRIQKELYPKKKSHFQVNFKVEKHFSNGPKSKDRLLDQYLTESKKLDEQNQKNKQAINQIQQKLAQTNDEDQKQAYIDQLRRLKLEQRRLVQASQSLANKINQL